LRDGDEAARQQAAQALAALGVAEQAVIDELLAGMGRRSLATYLSQPERQIGPAAKAALPAIRRRLATEDLAARCAALEAKWRIDGDAAYALEHLIPLLDRESGRACHAAVWTLVRMGGQASEAMPALVRALERYHDPNLLWAVRELAPHAPALAVPALRGALTQPGLADDAAIALFDLGEPATELVPHQLKRLKACRPNDDGEPMRIAYTIVIHGPKAEAYVGELIALLKHENREVRRAAAWSIPRVFADDERVIAALQEALNDPETAEEAAKGLKMLREARQ
jgi:hypothetical protein